MTVTQVKRLDVNWEPLKIDGLTEQQNREILDRLEMILFSWKGTPYSPNKRVKKYGVDCIRFVTGVIDELCGIEHVPCRTLPSDISFHDKATAMAGMKTFVRNYDFVKVTTRLVQPGDVLITGPNNGGPGHGVLAGIVPNTLFESSFGVGVHQIGLSINDTYRLFGHYRQRNRNQWCRGSVK